MNKKKNIGKMSLYIILIALIFLNVKCSGTEDNNSINKGVVNIYGKLNVAGNIIIDQNSNPVTLRGMSLFWSQIKGKYYNKECVKWLRDDWNCSVVRAAMGIEEADSIDGYLINKEKELNKVLTVIDAAIEYGIYVIVDWHDHHAHKNVEEAKKFFGMIAKKYGDKPNIIYEIYNEPMQISWENDVKPYSEEVIKTIREFDKDNLIFVGSPTWAQDVDIASKDPLQFENIVYTLHFYASSHKEDLRRKAQIALDNNVALFVSEFGTCEYTGDGIIDTVEVERWFDFMEKNNIGWCNWSIGDKVESSAALIKGAHENGNWKKSDISRSGTILRNKLKKINNTIN